MQLNKLNISQNRASTKYNKKEILLRILWNLCSPVFRFSPRPFFRWRCFLLRIFGARIGKNVHIYNSTTIYMPWNLKIDDWASIGEYAFIYNLGKITIGTKATISHRAHLCAGTHDYTSPSLPLIKPPISIGAQCWICTDSFIGPHVTIGEGAVVGARAVVTKDIKAWSIVIGNPAKQIKVRHVNN
jgi:putative colanic acid biosynthesis acetyltransferase WcaF